MNAEARRLEEDTEKTGVIQSVKDVFQRNLRLSVSICRSAFPMKDWM
jgi:hypothetical protein